MASIPWKGSRPFSSQVCTKCAPHYSPAQHLDHAGPRSTKVDEAERRIRSLLQCGGDARERAIQAGAQALDDRDNRDRNTGSDQAVFDRSRTLFVYKKFSNQVAHDIFLSVWGVAPMPKRYALLRAPNARA
jgi:hypothetical protein